MLASLWPLVCMKAHNVYNRRFWYIEHVDLRLDMVLVIDIVIEFLIISYIVTLVSLKKLVFKALLNSIDDLHGSYVNESTHLTIAEFRFLNFF